MKYNFNDLRIFTLVAANENFSAAARTAQITPAAVSAIVKRLEAELGVRLLERSSRACRLTVAGERFKDAAQLALSTLHEAEATLRQASIEPTGTIRISAPADLSRTVLSRMLDIFQFQYPKIVVVVTLTDAIQDLLRNSIDLALRYGDLPDSTLIARKLCVTRRLTLASPDYWARYGRPSVPSDLADHDCLCFNVGGKLDSVWQFVGASSGIQRVRVSGKRHSDDSALVKLWAIQGHGVINKSDIDVRDEIVQGLLEPVLQDFAGLPVTLSLVYSGSRQLPAAVRIFAEFVTAEFPRPS